MKCEPRTAAAVKTRADVQKPNGHARERSGANGVDRRIAHGKEAASGAIEASVLCKMQKRASHLQFGDAKPSPTEQERILGANDLVDEFYVNLAGQQARYPEISDDGLERYFSAGDGGPIMVATRSNVSSAFAAPTEVAQRRRRQLREHLRRQARALLHRAQHRGRQRRRPRHGDHPRRGGPAVVGADDGDGHRRDPGLLVDRHLERRAVAPARADPRAAKPQPPDQPSRQQDRAVRPDRGAAGHRYLGLGVRVGTLARPRDQDLGG